MADRLLLACFEGLLAQNGTPELTSDRAMTILWSVAALLGLSLLVIVVALLVRKRFAQRDESPFSGGFLLSDLRKMRDQGEISPEEYEAARSQILRQQRSELEQPPSRREPEPRREDAEGDAPEPPEPDAEDRDDEDRP
ncbi:MAG: SHOCT domain-containing protein [Phycisphaeraceae bacterium]